MGHSGDKAPAGTAHPADLAARRTIVPHEFMRMALNKAMKTSTLNIHSLIGGDTALIRDMAKAVLQQGGATAGPR